MSEQVGDLFDRRSLLHQPCGKCVPNRMRSVTRCPDTGAQKIRFQRRSQVIIYSQRSSGTANREEDFIGRRVATLSQVAEQGFSDFLQDRKGKGFASFLGRKMD